jgi:hypothetical protein
MSLFQAEAANRGAGETNAVLDCLDALDLKDVKVMVDAGLATRRVVQKIREKKGII